MSVSKLYQYGRSLNTHDLLKIIATVSMFIDHIGWYVLDDYAPFRLVGRLSAPIFFFLVGYSGKVHLRVSLVLYGIVLSLTGSFLHHHLWINILIIFLLIDYLLHYYPLERLSTLTRVAFFILLLIGTVPVYRYLEYGFVGILLAYAGRSVALQERLAPLWLGMTLFLHLFYQAIVFHFFASSLFLLSLALLFCMLFYFLSRYTLRTVPCPSWLRLPGLFIARYSLPIYFYHVILLQAFVVIYIYIVLTS